MVGRPEVNTGYSQEWSSIQASAHRALGGDGAVLDLRAVGKCAPNAWDAHRGFRQTPSRTSSSMRKREAKDIAPCRDRHVLHPIDLIAHRRSMHPLARVEVPESMAGSRFNRFHGSGIIPKEH